MTGRAVGVLILVVGLLACGTQEGDEPVEASAGTTATTAPETPATGPPPETRPTVGVPATRPPAAPTSAPADAAPDFALELGGGGTFVLSEEARPVFMVFWAEW